MGSNLRRQLREALPPSIKGLQRAVALEIADDARYDDAGNYDPENGRRSKARLADLVRWTAAKDELSVREMLRRLSLAGWEFRVPIGKDKNGNLMYAVPGKAMTFRVPDFEGPTTVGPYVETEAEGPTTVGGRANHGWGMAQPPLGVGPTTVGAGPTTVGPPSPVSSFSTKESPSPSPVAEDDSEASASATETEGGGGGEIDSSQEQDQKPERGRAAVFVDSLDYRGKPPGSKRRRTLNTRVRAALAAGWTENGLRRYLDISDDPKVRNPAAVYEHRLSDDELPDAGPAQAVAAGLLPVGADCYHDPAAATDPSHRIDPITGDPCLKCHPDAVQAAGRGLPPVCDSCIRANPAAQFNVRFRTRVINDVHQACPDCHPNTVGGTGARAASHTADDYTSGSVDDLYGPRLTGTDAKVAGWYAIASRLRAEEREHAPAAHRRTVAAPRHKPYSDDHWYQPADPVRAAQIPHCGSTDCDPVTRLKTEPDWTGEPHTSACSDCHPALKF
ncbi:hypothetical protein [Streptomyces albogriseolus]|uniref:hypothetical protein n=1 Tax=Streptomyces albogriseolus TaxID=1887 RepID=UPI00346157B5